MELSLLMSENWVACRRTDEDNCCEGRNMASPTVEVESRHARPHRPVPDRADPATTVSGVPIAALYTGEDLARLGITEAATVGRPGQFPFTRGIHEAMYRGRLWTMRQFAGFGTPRQTKYDQEL
jgi:methylmalonyl-CoA mutase N-terminal domain/subunit